MSAKTFSAALIGLDAELIEVEADVGGGDMGTVAIVGLPDASVSESRERVRSAIKNSNISFPRYKVTVNLAPADIKKHGPSYDLPIAISILIAFDKLKSRVDISRALFVGELALNGDLRPVNGILSIATMTKEKGFIDIYVPRENAQEAKLINGLNVFPVDNLFELFSHLSGHRLIKAQEGSDIQLINKEIDFDMANVQGQDHAKRALEIAAAGGHNVLMTGPPGSGKTLLARTLPSILPDFNIMEALEVTKIYSVSGKLKDKTAVLKTRPFRSPHHSASAAALIGGGAMPRPGEISLAHRGVLFLDEFGEFPRSVLEHLRQPLEDGFVNVSRVAGNLSFPAKFILVAATNPCPCGYYGDPEKECKCSPIQVINYKKKISGPILDRIDLHVEVPRLAFEKINSQEKAESSVAIKERVMKTKFVQLRRFKDRKIVNNAEMSSEDVKKYCETDKESQNLLKNAVKTMHLSPRAYFRILKVARTIADIEKSEKVTMAHISEALQYRLQDD